MRQKVHCEGSRQVRLVEFETGDGLFIPAGAASKHRAVAIAAGTRLLMIEDV